LVPFVYPSLGKSSSQPIKDGKMTITINEEIEISEEEIKILSPKIINLFFSSREYPNKYAELMIRSDTDCPVFCASINIYPQLLFYLPFSSSKDHFIQLLFNFLSTEEKEMKEYLGCNVLDGYKTHILDFFFDLHNLINDSSSMENGEFQQKIRIHKDWKCAMKIIDEGTNDDRSLMTKCDEKTWLAKNIYSNDIENEGDGREIEYYALKKLENVEFIQTSSMPSVGNFSLTSSVGNFYVKVYQKKSNKGKKDKYFHRFLTYRIYFSTTKIVASEASEKVKFFAGETRNVVANNSLTREIFNQLSMTDEEITNWFQGNDDEKRGEKKEVKNQEKLKQDFINHNVDTKVDRKKKDRQFLISPFSYRKILLNFLVELRN
jgi:hypothetical protein